MIGCAAAAVALANADGCTRARYDDLRSDSMQCACEWMMFVLYLSDVHPSHHSRAFEGAVPRLEMGSLPPRYCPDGYILWFLGEVACWVGSSSCGALTAHVTYCI